MGNDTVFSVSVIRACVIRKFLMAAIVAFAGFCPSGMLQAETHWTPLVNIYAVKDDNVLFERTEAVDDYVYNIQPGLRYDYDQELTEFSADGRVLIRRYQDNDDLDGENYRFDLKGNTKVTERFGLRGRYRFIKDTTLDSELEEIGRIFSREDRFSHEALLAPSINLTERTNIGLIGRYRNVEYDSDSKIDYTRWGISLPVRWRLGTQIDTFHITPGYTNRDSDDNRSDTYSFRVGWDHESTERLTVKLSAGARFTEHEVVSRGETEDDWGALGNLEFNYDFETGSFNIDFQKDLANTANGDQVDINRVILRLRWNFTERMGLELSGRYYYTQTEGEIDDDTREYFQAGPELFYYLTENHIVLVAYEYSQEDLDQTEIEVESRRVERNRVWAGIRLNFPLY